MKRLFGRTSSPVVPEPDDELTKQLKIAYPNIHDMTLQQLITDLLKLNDNIKQEVYKLLKKYNGKATHVKTYIEQKFNYLPNDIKITKAIEHLINFRDELIVRLPGFTNDSKVLYILLNN